MKQHPYEKSLQAWVIKKFIQENLRTPTDLELRLELRQAERTYPGLREKGFSGLLVEKPQFASESSAGDESLNRQAIHLDVDLGSTRLDELTERLERSFRALHATSKNLKRRLDDVESRVDNVLLLSGNTDVFTHGVEENFVVQDLVDFANTTASVESGFVTMGREGFGLVDMGSVHVTYSTTADKGTVGVQNSSTADSLKYDDGTFWECLVYTTYQQGRVSLLLDLALDQPESISEIRFTTQVSGMNSRNTVTTFYSLDGKTWKALEPQEAVITTGENVFPIGLEGVQKIRIMISKDRYDNTTAVNNQYVYVFSLDSVKLYSKSYAVDGESVLYAGPYEVTDEEGQVINFTKATADLCLTAGDEDAVGLYLGVDGETYYPVDHGDSGLGVVSFTNGSSAGTAVSLDTALTGDPSSMTGFTSGLTDQQLIPLKPTEALLNIAVDSTWASKVVRKSIVVKRNIPYADSSNQRVPVYGVASGWSYSSGNKLYKTTVYVPNEQGLTLNLGSTSAYINGLLMSGSVHLQQGYTVFETTDSNWREIPPGLNKLSALRKKDPLYPYNHRYLIEGYVYPDTFIGERVYSGVEEYFGALLTYVPPELFAVPESDTNLGIYTLDETEGTLMFPVKINRQDSSWSQELFESNWSISRGENNHLWLKMILNSSSGFRSPVISSVRMRVI